MSPNPQPPRPNYHSPHRAVRVGQDPGDLRASGQLSPALTTALGLLSAAGTVLGAYHGYKRNDSIGWAIGWGLLGGLFPFITIPVSLAQGFGQPAHARDFMRLR